MEGFFEKLLVAVPTQHGLKCLNDLQKKENVIRRQKKASHYTEKNRRERRREEKEGEGEGRGTWEEGMKTES